MGNQYGRNIYEQGAEKIFAAASCLFKYTYVSNRVYQAVIHSFSPTTQIKQIRTFYSLFLKQRYQIEKIAPPRAINRR